jgi:hypothetical protein
VGTGDDDDDEYYLLSYVPTNEDVGEYEVTITAADGEGGEAEVTFDLVVDNINNAPRAVIDSPSEGDTFFVGEEISFDGTGTTDPDSIHGDEKLSHKWQKGSKTIGEEENFAYAFQKAGEVTIRLTVYDNSGLSDIALVNITIEVDPDAVPADGDDLPSDGTDGTDGTGGTDGTSSDGSATKTSKGALGMGQVGGVDVAVIVFALVAVIIVVAILGLMLVMMTKPKPPAQPPLQQQRPAYQATPADPYATPPQQPRTAADLYGSPRTSYGSMDAGAGTAPTPAPTQGLQSAPNEPQLLPPPQNSQV